MSTLRLYTALLSSLLLAACASTLDPQQVPAPVVAAQPAVTNEPAIAQAPPMPPPPPVRPDVVAPTAPAATAPAWSNPKQGRALLNRLMPAKIKDRAGWSNDIFAAFEALRIPYTAEYFCAATSVIEQESSWEADPVVPGLGKMVWKQIELKADEKGIPMPLVSAALKAKSSNGQSFRSRIDKLRTEREMNLLYEEMSAEAESFGVSLSSQNPVRTGGPMQVSIDFATSHARAWPYPYPVRESMRREVFTRRGGVYFGIANLLHYQAPYDSLFFRFADYNAGRYSSRNAAFQAAVAKLSKRKIDLDGDLLRYSAGRPSKQASSTLQAIRPLAGKLKLSPAEIERDLLLEKTSNFGQSPLYQRLFALADHASNKPLPRAISPQIRLSSPKITRKLTTEWFAKRVDWRYQRCLAKVAS